MSKRIATVVLTLIVSSATFAASNLCPPIPKDQWQPVSNLEKKLTAEGWKIKNTKVDRGCYEAYGTDGKGQRVEIHFDPKTLEPVKG